LKGGLALNSAKKIIAVVMVAVICFSFAGCRTRTSKTGSSEVTTTAQSEQPIDVKNDKIDEKTEDNSTPTPIATAVKNTEPSTSQSTAKSFKQSKSAVQSKKSSDSATEVIKQSSDDTNIQGGTNSNNPNENGSGNLNDDSNDDSSNRNDLTEKDDDEQETPMHTAINKYEELMASNNAEIYECQRLNVYFELEQEFQSVTRDNAIHELITDAGGYNVAEIKYSSIDAQWVVGKSPDIIVKVVDSSILGSGVTSTDSANAVKNEIMSRADWNNIPAVQNSKILLLSNELLDTQAGKTTAELYMAKAMYDAIYGDIDVEGAYEEMTGTTLDGIYAY
jgi:hypothetical protein